MRRAFVVLIAGLALAAAIGGAGVSSGADVITVGTTPLTTESPTYTDSKGLEPFPSGARAEPDRRLPHSNTAAYVLLGLVGVALLAALVLFLATRLLAIEPRWVADGRHSFAEAGWRVSNTWDEFKDWLRLGH
jgi:hypothetical protein